MKRMLNRGFGKLTPKIWQDLAGLVRLVENDGRGLKQLAAEGTEHAARKTKVILAKITGYNSDPRRNHGQTPTGGFGVVTRWMYDWIRVIPKPDRAANPDSITFVEAGAETEYEDSQTKWEGSYTGFGFGPALNLMEQNNREVGSVSGRGGPYAKVAPGFPLQESESGSTRTNYLMPEDWSVQPISVNTIVVMYLVHSQRFAD